MEYVINKKITNNKYLRYFSKFYTKSIHTLYNFTNIEREREREI